MEYFDFHTHAFTDSLAERAMLGLSATSSIRPATDGTVSGLKNIMKKNGIRKAMILPIATKPSQQTVINNWASEIMDENIYCCGTVHPDSENAVEEVERIKSLGLYGLKFHSEYQHFRPDEEKMFPIYKKASELGLFIVFHGGWDPFGTDDVLATPERFARVAEKNPNLKIITAHMGGLKMFDKAEDYLAGKYENVYLDTGVAARYISDEQFYRIIKKHGAEKILYGSDCPWDNPENEINLIERIPLSKEEKELIFHINAEKLTGLI
mgnify:CR=1 FL=1